MPSPPASATRRTLPRPFRALVVATLLLACGSCMAVFSRSEYGLTRKRAPVYTGVAQTVRELSLPGADAVTFAFVLVDLPLTLVADTLWLPFDLTYWIGGASDQAEPIPAK